MKRATRPQALPAPEPVNADGTQAIRRVATLLREMAKAGGRGASLAELSRGAELPRSTVHRMIRCLVDEDLAEALPDKRYQVGRLVHELGLSAMASAGEVARWRPLVDAIAAGTGATTYLMRRSGAEAVCVLKADGHSVVRFVPVEVGQRRLLGVGAGATALLAALDDTQVDAVIRTIVPGLQGHPRITADSLRTSVRLARRTGFAVSQGTVVDNGFGIGAIVPSDDGVPHLAVSIAVHASVVTESSIVAWKRVMADAIAAACRASSAA